MSDEAAHADVGGSDQAGISPLPGRRAGPDQAAFIVGFADTPVHYRALLARRAAQLTRVRVPAELVVIDQDREAVVLRRHVWVTPESPGVA